MWNSNKSLQLSCICTRFVMVLVVVCAAALPYLIDIYLSIGPHYISEMDMGPFMVILYACCIPALAALFNLDRLLRNIKKEEVIAFIGLILRVVKNVIEQAVIIKAENDFTI